MAYGAKGIFISQRKYMSELLAETTMLECRSAPTHVEHNLQIMEEVGDPVDNVQYQRLVGRLIYLAHTRPDIGYGISVVSRYMHDPWSGHLDAVHRIHRYLKGCPGKGIMFGKN
jgi:hypothetical protein